MAKTIKLTKAQEAALIWAINTWENSFDGFGEDDEFYQEFAKAYAKLYPIYETLESED
jgi:hypothetical protein